LIVDVKTLNDRAMYGFDYGNDGTGDDNDALAVVKEVCLEAQEEISKDIQSAHDGGVVSKEAIMNHTSGS